MATIYVTIAIVKVKLIPDIYTWANVLINLWEENAEKILFLASEGGQNSILRHVPLLMPQILSVLPQYEKPASKFSKKWESKPVCSAWETTNDIEILYLASRVIILTNNWIIKVLIGLRAMAMLVYALVVHMQKGQVF